MSETHKRSPNTYTDKKTKVAASVAAVAMTLGLGIVAKRGTSAEGLFNTNIPVPAETSQHIDYTVKAGDTEGSIAASHGHANDLNYMNMLNEQLPTPEDKHNRMLHPGEQLNLPPN